MNFNVYVDDATGRQLEKLSRRRKVARNALIREAVQDLVRRSQQEEAWSPGVLAWTGAPDVPPFESHRTDLAPQADDDPLK
jgi:predicted transcriptional regulator